MVEVFYRGYGCWAWKRSYPDVDPISPEFVASGVFTLLEHDANAYKYTKKLDKHIIGLLPSTTHPDSEFLRWFECNQHLRDVADRCYFRINVEDDYNKDRTFRVIDADTFPINSKPANPQIPQDKIISLKLPKRADDWAFAVSDMFSEFLSEFGTAPNQTQAWIRLNEVPPKGYSIGQGVDRGEPCLTMPGGKSLSRTAFNKRWSDYTADDSGE